MHHQSNQKRQAGASRNDNADACIYASGGDSDATATANPGPPSTPADAGPGTAASAGGDVHRRSAHTEITRRQLCRCACYRSLFYRGARHDRDSRTGRRGAGLVRPDGSGKTEGLHARRVVVRRRRRPLLARAATGERRRACFPRNGRRPLRPNRVAAAVPRVAHGDVRGRAAGRLRRLVRRRAGRPAAAAPRRFFAASPFFELRVDAIDATCARRQRRGVAASRGARLDAIDATAAQATSRRTG